MKRWKRIFLWSIAIFALFLIAAAIVLPAWIDPNSYREMVENRMEETLGREVSIGEIGLKVFPVLAISVANITIQEDPPVEGAPFLEAGALRGSMKILPLLRKKFEIRKVSLEKPMIRLRRDEQGAWNFDPLLAALTSGKDSGEQAPAGEGPEFQVSRFDIREATISLEDREIEPGQVSLMELTDLNLSVRDFVPGKRLRYRIDFSLPPHQGQEISSSGSLGLVPNDSGYPFDASLEVHELDPAFAGPYLSRFFDLEINRGRVSLNLEGKGETEGPIDLAGEIHLEQISPRLDLSFDMSLSGDRKTIDFRELEMESADSQVGIRGSLNVASPRTHLDVEVVPSHLQLQDLRNLLRSIESEMPIDVDSPDPVEFAGRLRGYPDTLSHADIKGWMKVSRLTFRDPALTAAVENISGRLEFQPNHLALRNFSSKLGNSDIGGNLDIKDFDNPEVQFHLKSRQTHLDQILSYIPTEGGEEASTTRGSAGSDWSDSLKKFSASGSLEIDQGSVNQVKFAGLHGTIKGGGRSDGRMELAGGVQVAKIFTPAGKPAPWDIDLSFDMSISGGHDKYQFRDLQLKSAGSKIRLKGAIDISSPQTYVDMEVLPSRLLLEDLKNLLGSLDTELPVDITSPDPVEITFRLKGHPATLREAELAGSLEVSRLTLRHPSLSSPMENVQGRVELESNHFAVRDFSGTLGSSDIGGQLDLRNFDAPDVKFQLKSRQAKLGEILSFLKPGTEPSAIPSSPGAETDDWQDYMEKLSATGSLEILEGSIDTLAFSGFKGTMKLEGQQIRFQPLEIRIYGGTYSGSANMDMGNDPPKFRFQSRLADVDAFPLFSENMDVKELRGTLSGELDLNGKMEGYEGTLRSLKGKGTLKLEKGRIEALNVVEMLSKVSGIFGERTLQRLSRQISQEGTDFSELIGHFLIADGSMNIEDLALRSRDLDLVGAGTLNLLDLGLNASVQVLMSPEVSGSMRTEKSRAGEFFWNSSTNRVEFPLRLAGSVLAPTPSVDFQRASQTLARSKVSSLLKKKLGIPERPVTPATPPSTGEPAKPATETSPTASSDPSVEILESRFSGNLLSPYLKLAGRFQGNDLSRASLRITDGGGREILFEENAFPEIAATPAGGNGAQIAFFKKVSGKTLLGRGKDFLVTITLFNSQGGSSEKRIEVRR